MPWRVFLRAGRLDMKLDILCPGFEVGITFNRIFSNEIFAGANSGRPQGGGEDCETLPQPRLQGKIKLDNILD